MSLTSRPATRQEILERVRALHEAAFTKDNEWSIPPGQDGGRGIPTTKPRERA